MTTKVNDAAVEAIVASLRHDPKVFATALELALRSEDQTKTAQERAVALAELEFLCKLDQEQNGHILRLEHPRVQPKEQPQYKWVNGARVRIK